MGRNVNAQTCSRGCSNKLLIVRQTAPELIDALKQARDVLAALQPNRPAGGIQDRIEAVLAKAEGR